MWKKQGPFSLTQVKGFLKTGLCSDKDFIWRPGFKEWARISLRKEFSTHPGHTLEDILIQQNRKYQVQKPRNIRYCARRATFLHLSYKEL